MNKQRFFAALPLLLAGFCMTAWSAENITTPEQLFPQLDAILRRTVAQSPRMISRAIDLEIAENNRISYRAGLLPSVGGSYSIYEGQDKRTDMLNNSERLDVTKLYYSFSISQPLFHWGDRRNSAKVGEIQQAITQGQVREAYRLLAQEVRSAYLRLIVDKMVQKRATYNAELSRKVLAQAEERLKKKVISEAQIFVLRIDAERAQLASDRTNFDVENRRASFARLTGGPIPTDAEIPDAIPEVKDQNESAQRLLAEFLAQKSPMTAEAVEFRHKQEIERLGLVTQKNRLKPKFNLVVAATQDEQSYSQNITQKYEVQSYFGGISVSWSIFDGFATGAAVRNSLARLRQMDNDYRVLTENLAQQAQSQARGLEFASRSAAIGEKLLVSGEGNLNYRNEQFARGVISEEDVSAARMGFYSAQIDATTYRADYITQLCTFLSTVREDPVLANLTLK